MPSEQSEAGDDHPLEEPLTFNDGVGIEEVLDLAEDRVSPRLLESSDPRLAEISFTFVDDHGVKRKWAVASEEFDRDAYKEADDAE